MKAGLTLITVLLTINLTSQSKNFIDQPYLETTATSDTLVTPDEIYMSITITEKDTKNRKSLEVMESQMANKLRSLGIDVEKQLTVADASSNFKRYLLKRKDVLKSRNYILLVYEATTMAEVMIGLEELEISNVYIRKAEYSKMNKLKLHLKSEAVMAAKQNAEALLAPLSQNAGRAIHIADNTRDIRAYDRLEEVQFRVGMEYDEGNTLKSKVENISFEKIRVESVVTVRFAIE